MHVEQKTSFRSGRSLEESHISQSKNSVSNSSGLSPVEILDKAQNIEDVSKIEAPQTLAVVKEKPLAIDLSDEFVKIQRLIQSGGNPEDYWQFFKAQAEYYANESYAKLGAVEYTHDIVADDNWLKLWIAPMGKGAYESYLDGAQKVDPNQESLAWYRERCKKEAESILALEDLINTHGSGAVYVDISPAPFEVSQEFLEGTMFGSHSFVRVHQVIIDENGASKLFSRAHRTEVPPELLEKINHLLTGEGINWQNLLGKFSFLHPNWIRACSRDGVFDIRNSDISILVEKIISSQEKQIEISPDAKQNGGSNLTKEIMSIHYEELEPVLKSVFNDMVRMAKTDPRFHEDSSQQVAKKFQTWEKMLQAMISGDWEKNLAPKKESRQYDKYQEPNLESMYLYYQTQTYMPSFNGCGTGSGFAFPSSGALYSISPQFAGIMSYWGLTKLSYNGENYLEDPNLCRCEKAKGPHFHCPGKIKVSKKGKLKKGVESVAQCNHAIRVGLGIDKCPKCGAGKRC
jgi:hypothetical protein